MHFSRALVAAALASFGQVQAVPLEGAGLESRQSDPALPDIDPSTDAVDALLQLQKAAEDVLEGHKEGNRGSKQCTLANARIRKNWYVQVSAIVFWPRLTLNCRSSLSSNERKDYIKAVQCLRQLPSKGPAEWVAAQNRYDDFVAQHVELTIEAHGSGPFLTWHRAFVWSYETALIEECGYKGTQPVSSQPLFAKHDSNNKRLSTGTGSRIRKISPRALSLMAATLAWEVTVNSSPTMVVLVVLAISICPLVLVAAASRAAPSSSKQTLT